jgi:hypothetical protein
VPNDLKARIQRVLADSGASWSFTRRERHPAVVIEHRGKCFVITIPVTPSDWRSHHNTIAKIRRRFGLRPARAAE